ILELAIIKKHSFLINSIEKLEREDISSIQQIEIIKDVKIRLENDILKQKFNSLQNKNPDLEFFYHLNDITSPNDDKIYLNVPLTTVDVERSFSKMGIILDDLRRGMSIKTQEMLTFLYFNKNSRH
ncbi:hypothetical protein DMUE_5230, partial [Dictyocoela muelleri]